MSTIVLAKCWPLQAPPTAKAVLISLADNANDQGECWPSIPTISMRTCFSERAVHGAIKWLEAHCIVAADRSNGRHTRYVLTPETYVENPAEDAVPCPKPPQDLRPSNSGNVGDFEGGTPADAAVAPAVPALVTLKPPQELHPGSKCTAATDAITPAVGAVLPPQIPQSPPQQVLSNRKEPSLEPSVNPKKNQLIKKTTIVIPDWIPADAWAAYVEMRAEIRKPLTSNAFPLAIKRLQTLREAGEDLLAVLEQSTLNSWQGLFSLRLEGKKKGGAWWLDDTSRLAKAAEVGVKSIAGESAAALDARIQAAIDNGGSPPASKPSPAMRIADYQNNDHVSRDAESTKLRSQQLHDALRRRDDQ